MRKKIVFPYFIVPKAAVRNRHQAGNAGSFKMVRCDSRRGTLRPAQDSALAAGQAVSPFHGPGAAGLLIPLPDKLALNILRSDS